MSWTAYYNSSLAVADALGARLRILSVALLPEYVTATVPADNFTASIPWSRASSTSVPSFSAFCFYYGVQNAEAYPEVPVGLIANPWGGVAIQVYMSPSALAACPAPTKKNFSSKTIATAEAIVAADRAVASMRNGASPTNGSCLYNSMMHPLLSIPIGLLLWLQGESNSVDPVGYECLQRAMVNDFRSSWAAVGAAPVLPFLFVQLACWPDGNGAVIANFRYAQSQLSREPRTGMAVSADLCDPAGAFHPIHPPWKAELARRAFLWADAEIYGNSSSPRAAPVVTQLYWDAWDASWGDFHWGTGAGSYVCGSGGTFTCGGVRLTFDRPVALRDFYMPPSAGATERVYGWAQGAASGFTISQGSAWVQPMALTGVSADGLTVQLNVTYIGPGQPQGAELQYAWSDYPAAMPLIELSSGLPVAPFNLTVARSPPRPTNGTCTFLANTDGASDGVAVPGGSQDACCAACWANVNCVAAAFSSAAPTECWLKYGAAQTPKVGTTLCVINDGR